MDTRTKKQVHELMDLFPYSGSSAFNIDGHLNQKVDLRSSITLLVLCQGGNKRDQE